MTEPPAVTGAQKKKEATELTKRVERRIAELSMNPRAIKKREQIGRARLAGRCLDCSTETAFTNGDDEYYMVHDALWLQANPQGVGMLCIGCLEERIGRRLATSDFTDGPINRDDRDNRSKRLTSRLLGTMTTSASADEP